MHPSLAARGGCRPSPHETPEILRLDLARTLLELRAWSLAGADELPWLDPPPPATLARGERLLALLGAVDPESGALTGTGRRMLELPAEPRVARLLVEAERAGCPADGALLAALAGERDVLASARTLGGGAADFPPGASDILLRAALFDDAARHGFRADACRALGLDPGAVRAVERARGQLARGARPGVADERALLRCTLAGFPDRVARRRTSGSPRAVMVGGTGVVLARESVVREAEIFVAVDLERTTGPEARVRVASAVEAAWLPELFPGAVGTTRELVFDRDRERVVERVRSCYHDLVLAETVRSDVDRVAAGEVLAAAVRGDADRLLGERERELLARLAFLERWMPELGWAAGPEVLAADAVAALAAGRVSVAELRQADVCGAIVAALSPAQRAALAREAPAEYRLPDGRSVPVAYPADRAPAVRARIQQVFGLTATPRLAAGRVALVFELLAPSGRPVQVTDDLASFWRTTYAEVRRQLRGRYPKHAWPEDPFAPRR